MVSSSLRVIEPSEQPTAPHAVAAEQALLGALLINNEVWEEVDGKIGVSHFYDKRHQVLFEIMQQLAAEKYADDILLVQKLRNSDQLIAAGGEEYIADLVGIGAALVNVSAYVEEIKKAAQMRQILAVLNETNARVLRPGDSTPQDILDEAEAKLFGIVGAHVVSGMKSAGEKAAEFSDNLIDIINKKQFDRLLGLQTGFPTLDKMTTGFHGGDLVIVAGRPGAGKTAFALNIIRHISATGDGVVVFSLEMSDKHLVMRLISQERIDMQKLRTGKHRGQTMSGEDIRNLNEAAYKLKDRNIFIDDSGMLNELETRSRARRQARFLARQNKKLSLVVVDYLQLLSSSGSSNNEVRAQEVALISRALKSLAKELDVPVLALSQLNRSAESRTTKEPQLSDLRESGSIEQDADIVMFLYEEKSENHQYDKPPDEGTPITLIIGKQRNGPVGKINMQFHKEFSRFAESAATSHGEF